MRRVVVEIECYDAELAGDSYSSAKSYNQSKYSEIYTNLEKDLKDKLGNDFDVSVNKNPGPGKGYRIWGNSRDWFTKAQDSWEKKEVVKYPRPGAFEVLLKCPDRSSTSRMPASLELWSKIKSHTWPNAENLASVIQRLLTATRDDNDQELEYLLDKIKAHQAKAPIDSSTQRRGTTPPRSNPPMFFGRSPRTGMPTPVETRLGGGANAQAAKPSRPFSATAAPAIKNIAHVENFSSGGLPQRPGSAAASTAFQRDAFAEQRNASGVPGNALGTQGSPVAAQTEVPTNAVDQPIAASQVPFADPLPQSFSNEADEEFEEEYPQDFEAAQPQGPVPTPFVEELTQRMYTKHASEGSPEHALRKFNPRLDFDSHLDIAAFKGALYNIRGIFTDPFNFNGLYAELGALSSGGGMVTMRMLVAAMAGFWPEEVSPPAPAPAPAAAPAPPPTASTPAAAKVPPPPSASTPAPPPAAAKVAGPPSPASVTAPRAAAAKASVVASPPAAAMPVEDDSDNDYGDDFEDGDEPRGPATSAATPKSAPAPTPAPAASGAKAAAPAPRIDAEEDYEEDYEDEGWEDEEEPNAKATAIAGASAQSKPSPKLPNSPGQPQSNSSASTAARGSAHETKSNPVEEDDEYMDDFEDDPVTPAPAASGKAPVIDDDFIEESDNDEVPRQPSAPPPAALKPAAPAQKPPPQKPKPPVNEASESELEQDDYGDFENESIDSEN